MTISDNGGWYTEDCSLSKEYNIVCEQPLDANVNSLRGKNNI
jgi:hypothetical protein